MKVLKLSTVALLLLSCILPHKTKAHSEIVANIMVAYAEEGLVLTASLEKKHLAFALKKEAKCQPKDMLRICASEYVQQHIKVAINDEVIELKKLDQQLTKSSLIITYLIKCGAPIQSVNIQSDYMIQYNDHSKVKVISRLAEKDKSYSLSVKRKEITILI